MPSQPPRAPQTMTHRPYRPQRTSLAREQMAEAARFRRSLLLVVASAVAPGSAQYIAGNKELGKIALRIWAGLLIVAALVIWQVSASTLIGLAVHGWVITLFKLVAFTVGLAWVALLVDAWRLGRPPSLSRGHRLVMLAATIGLAVLVTSPFIFATRYATAAHNAVVEIFPSSSVAAASDGRLNILLLGNDAGKGRQGVRPDSITLASIDARNGETALISLPRNLEKARFEDGTPADQEFPRGFSGEGDRLEYMLNATWTFGQENPELFPDADNPGAEAVKQAVAGTLDMDVHYYVTIDLAGFKDLIDSIGGITVRIEEEIPIGQDGKVLEPGVQKLDGYEALWYARSRTGTSDYDRMARQRCVLGAFVNEADPATVAANFTGLLKASESVIKTDIPASELPDLIDLAMKAKSQPVASLQLVPPLITPADPDIDVIREEVNALLEGEHRSPSASDTGPVADVTTLNEATSEPAESEDESGGGAETQAPPSDPADITSACSYD